MIVWSALQGGVPRSEGDGAVKYRNKKQQEDSTFLKERHDEIDKAYKDWYLNQSSQRPDTKTVEGTALKTIHELVVARLPEGENRDMCVSWVNDMAEMIYRMCAHWTGIERKSLISFLARFKKVLEQLLNPPPAESAPAESAPAESVYHPAARQPAADHTKVIELFVSGAGFALAALPQTLMIAVHRGGGGCTGELERSSDQD